MSHAMRVFWAAMILVGLLFALGACAPKLPAAAPETRPDLPERALAPCAAPGEFLAPGPMARAEFEIAVGRMGDALAACGGGNAARMPRPGARADRVQTAGRDDFPTIPFADWTTISLRRVSSLHADAGRQVTASP